MSYRSLAGSPYVAILSYRWYITGTMPTLSSLFGQEAAVGALRRSLQAEQLPGAYLFVGTPGVGKGWLARALAQAAACLTPTPDPFDACGACESCRRAEGSM